MANQDVIRRWVDALRSGKYKQGEGALVTVEFPEDGGERKEYHCCLGVLCELAAEAGVATRSESSVKAHGGWVTFNGETGMPDYKVMEWAGVSQWMVDSPEPQRGQQIIPDCDCGVCKNIPVGRQRSGLSALNDNHGTPFNVIADLVEKEWLALADASAPA